MHFSCSSYTFDLRVISFGDTLADRRCCSKVYGRAESSNLNYDRRTGNFKVFPKTDHSCLLFLEKAFCSQDCNTRAQFNPFNKFKSSSYIRLKKSTFFISNSSVISRHALLSSIVHMQVEMCSVCREGLRILKYRKWKNSDEKVHFESGIRMGNGVFNLVSVFSALTKY